MKMNIKKVATIVGSALMLGATAGMAAAAAYPAPFVSSGAANVAIVVGGNAALSDGLAASAIAADLATDLAAQTATSATTTSGSTVSGGDSYQIQKTSQKFQLGTSIADIKASLDDTQLPTLLKQGKFIDKNNDEFDYKQSISLADLQLEMFNDRNYKKDTPTLGFMLSNEAPVLNYTLDMTDKPYFNNLETTDLPIMGKMYYILDVTSTNDTITLLDSANDAIVAEGETSTLVVGDKSYELSVWVGQSGSNNVAKVTINGETTNSLQSGQTQKLSDGAYIGIKDIMYSSKESAVSKVELSIGSGKLKIADGSKVEMNDESVKNVYGYINNASGQLASIELRWTANDKTFITTDTSLTMPGFGAVKLSFGGMAFPKTETIVVEAGGDTYMQLSEFPLRYGSVDVPVVGKASGNANYTYIGSDTNELVVTTSARNLTFDGSSDSNDDFLIASWSDGSDAESYLIRPINFDDPLTGDDTVQFEYNDGSGWNSDDKTKFELGDTLSYGNLDLDIAALNSSTGGQAVTLTRDTSSSFSVLYTKEGLKVQMPFINTTAFNVGGTYHSANISTLGCAAVDWSDGQLSRLINNGTTSVNATCTQYSYALQFTEENKDSDIALGQTFNVSLGNNGASNYYAATTGVAGYNSSREKSATDVYETWTYSPLATKLVEDNSGDQDMVTITYHGAESFGDVFVLAPSATVTAGSGSTNDATQLGAITIKDSEVSSVSGKNLIVIGGSCVNSVAAELLSGAACEAAFTAASGVKAGEALIKSFARGDKVALLVAGYNAEDTTKAATYLTMKGANTTVGAALKVTSATEATAITA